MRKRSQRPVVKQKKESKFWCVNFDCTCEILQPGQSKTAVLDHGLDESMWLMQYHYPHSGYWFQGGRQAAATTRNWNAAGKLNEGDFLLAYGSRSRFYAAGRVTRPRPKPWHVKRKPRITITNGSIAEVTGTRQHKSCGVVKYTDVFYEDFTDPFDRRVKSKHSGQCEVWKYNQRIDVEKWTHQVREGVVVSGMNSFGKRPNCRLAVFEIPKGFLHKVMDELCRHSGEPPIQ